MKKTKVLLALCAAMAAPMSMAAGLPACFKMVNEPGLNRFYAVVPTSAQSPVQASQETQAVTVFEYHIAASQPAERRLTLQGVMSGTAGFSGADLDWVNVGTTWGDASPMASVIARVSSGAHQSWNVTRNTGFSSQHQLEAVPCVVPD